MSQLAIIGGSGLADMPALNIIRREVVQTPFGAPSAPIIHGTLNERELAFLPRHGSGHTIAPHKINYLANIWALHHVGVKHIIGVAAVGGIHKKMEPLSIVVPDQIIDYTYGRRQTFFEQDLTHVTHIDFSYPYCDELRQGLLRAAATISQQVIPFGTYGATQGPRLETVSEIARLQRDGCDLVGMTGMPEAALAKELGMCYACCALVVNWAAGKGEGVISIKEIEGNLRAGMESVHKLLSAFASMI
jgi:5'-methylthioinosine phosphorylase